jgi:methionine synthase II (cobalamin-independent)
MTDALLNYILDAFKTHSHAPDLRGAITGLPGESFITLYTPHPTEALHQLARALESEFDELGRTVHIQVRRPAWSLRGWLACWGRHLLGFR